MNKSSIKDLQTAPTSLQPSPLQPPPWWRAVPPEEQQLLCDLFHVLRGSKRSPRPRVAHAATKWDRALRFLIKIRLIQENRRRPRLAPSPQP